MLKFGNKEFRNLQEQVFKNMKDIQDIMDGTTVLAEFGIKVVGQVNLVTELPDPSTYTGEFGDAYVVGASEPYDYYIYTRAFEGDETPQWFYLGKFPVPGPQGPQGESAGFGVVSASAEVGSVASASVTVSGPDTAKDMHFDFTIPSVDASSYVTISTDQTITGVKTFYEPPVLGTKTGRVDLQIGSTPNQIHLDTHAGTIPQIKWLDTTTSYEVKALLPNKSGMLLTNTTLSDNLKTINGQTIVGKGDIQISAGASEWGQITGTLSNQTDLQSALNNKANLTDIKTYTGSGNIKVTDDVITINDNPTFNEIRVNNGTAGLFVGPAGNVGSDYVSGSDYAAIRILNGTPELRNNSSTYSTSLKVDNTGIEIQKKDIASSTTVTKDLFEVADQAAQVVNKQDTISDLETIRSGATLGSTAVQPSTLSTELSTKQDTLVSGTNIKTINGNSILGSGDIIIQGGGGSSDIDNKTIITNASGKLETAVGGWKEVIVHPASAGIDTGSVTYNQDNGDFDKYDTTIATNIYNLMTGSDAPDFATITCTSDGGNNFTIKLTGLKNAQYNDDYWNSANDNFPGVDQNGNAGWDVQLYVAKSSDQIHVWFASQLETINSITNINFGGGPQYTETIYHKIDSNYLPEDIFDVTNMTDGPITDEQIEKFKKSAIVKDGDYCAYKHYQDAQYIRYIKGQPKYTYIDSSSIQLNQDTIVVIISEKRLQKSGGYVDPFIIYLDSSRLTGIKDNYDRYNLSTVLDGGYDGSAFNLSASDFTLDNDHYICNNSKFLEVTKNYLTWMVKNYQSNAYLGWFKPDENSSTSMSIDMNISDETEESSGRYIRTGTVTSPELLNSEVKIYTDTNEVISCNVIYTQAFIDVLTNNNINIFETEDPDRTGLIKKISPKFIPEEGYTNLAVSNQIKIGNTTLNETQLQALLNLLNK